MSALDRAQALLTAGRAEQALAELGRLPAAEAVGPLAMRLRCVALVQLDRWPEVADTARAGLAAGGPDPGLLLWLGRALAEQGHGQAAERALLDGLALAPTDVDLLCAYADVCLAHGQVDKAARLVAMAAAEDPHDPAVYVARVQLAHARGDDREAQRVAREFVGAHPENPAANALLGGTSAARGQIRNAYAGYRRAVAAMPTEQSFAESAIELKIAQHPLMLPLRPLLRFGTWKTWGAVLALMLGLRVVGQPVLAGLVAVVWFGFCVYSWVVPPLVRRWLLRRWG
jgi:tetratricopeptide (TPR) repeat protein